MYKISAPLPYENVHAKGKAARVSPNLQTRIVGESTNLPTYTPTDLQRVDRY
jgi:hypothetical protein